MFYEVSFEHLDVCSHSIFNLDFCNFLNLILESGHQLFSISIGENELSEVKHCCHISSFCILTRTFPYSEVFFTQLFWCFDELVWIIGISIWNISCTFSNAIKLEPMLSCIHKPISQLLYI